MAQEPDDTLLEAHTRGDPENSGAATADQDAMPLALIEGSHEIVDQDVLALTAELVAAPRRARGRPPGATNKRNDDMVAYLQALGHRDPAVTLSMIQTANTQALARAIGAEHLDVLKLQQKAASDLMPYFYAKKPQQLDLPEGAGQRPVMIIGQLNGDINTLVDGGFMSAGVPPVPAQRNQQLSGDDPCDKT